MELYEKIFDQCEIERFVNEFKSSNYKKYIMGRNVLSSAIMKKYEFDGVIDDFTNETQWNGKKIFKCCDIEKEAIVLVATTISSISAIRKLRENGINIILDAFCFSKSYPFEKAGGGAIFRRV